MIRVFVTKQSNYPVKATVIKKKLADFLAKNGIVSDAEISVAIVGEAKMSEIGKKYLKDRKLHNVLSFTPTEVKGFVYPPDATIHLGEVIICYPEALKEAKEENILIDERVYELAEHGANHLLGIHHEDD
ncbi:MAG: putative rRNA maturation factor [Candidatus Woesebacteria bacterium GW2011_GWB1_39_10]|uniref:Putative rRNA maturation factor n=2 Tax=Candidatus Woeseibacteriota TaxID=1752722 RepID=A0A0G0XX46_9BACT|nr:MAG: putative rRNA maturation factor [Candidatus Woesebacteria bacterium GW2011_GWB1_39_10]KKR92497.1 MAG: putative rRNA maturation factor [Candidatus Woesebacteria bacterium GW2011_GWA1_41_13b]